MHFTKKMGVTVAIALTAALGMAGCSQNPGTKESTSSETELTFDELLYLKAGDDAPAEVKDGSLTLALVTQLSSGDSFQQSLAAAKKQAGYLNIKLDVFEANGDDSKNALYLQQAIDSKPDAIVLDHGFGDTLNPLIAKANAAGIPVMTYYVDGPAGDLRFAIDLGDDIMTEALVAKIKEDTGGKGDAINIFVPGYPALEARNAVWQKFKKDNPGINQVAEIGVVSADTLTVVADQTKAALQANPKVSVIFAPWDEFAKGAALAVTELGLQDKISVYGADISDADISVMTQEGNPWKWTGTTDASNLGSSYIRCGVLIALGVKLDPLTQIPPTLIGQSDLIKNDISNMAEVRNFFTDLATPEICSADWMVPIK